jgi:hypothetical protein
MIPASMLIGIKTKMQEQEPKRTSAQIPNDGRSRSEYSTVSGEVWAEGDDM